MSLNMNGDRLLAEALADAMDRDLTDVPPREQLEKQHRFSGKFVRRIKKIEAGKGETRDFKRLGSLAKRYSGLAAMLVCVIGLAAVLGVSGSFFRMGASKDKAMTADDCGAADAPADAETAESAADGADDAADAGDEGADMFLEEDELAVYDDGVADRDDAKADTAPEDGGDEGDSVSSSDLQEEEAGQKPPAPDWQEQLLAESAKADELAAWLLNTVYDDGTIDLESSLVTQGTGNGQSRIEKTVRISRVYEVYYESAAGEWERVYHTEREMTAYEPGTIWVDNYSLAELNMNMPGRYRLVRQVNNYRQVLALTLDAG